jgi:hypothetical protein
MNPFLEQEVIWHDFQKRFLSAAAAHLAKQVLPRYIVLIDEHVYLHDLPPETSGSVIRPDLSVARGPESGVVPGAAASVLEAPAEVVLPYMDVERESFLSVHDRQSREVITVVELLSPTSKRPGDNRQRYLAKRADILNSEVHLVEIDLLRCSMPLPADDRPPCTYSVLVSRAGQRPRAGFWPFGLRDPLPVVPVPLRTGEPDARLDLRAVIDRIYDESGYQFFIYQREPNPPLSADAATWAKTFLPGAQT